MVRSSSFAPRTVHLRGPGMLKVNNARLTFSVPGERPVRLDPARLQAVFIYEKVTLSDKAIKLLFEHGIAVSWMTPGGRRCRGRIVPENTRGTALRVAQHTAFRGSPRIEFARAFVTAKIDSQIDAHRRYQRSGATLPVTSARFAELRGRAEAATALDSLRGIEGTATRLWFRNFAAVLKTPWTFPGRVKRPPTDPVNALLSLGYTWLTSRLTAQIQAHGLEANLGALHDLRPGRPALACDVIEPLRVPLVDRWVLQTCNTNILRLEDFHDVEGKGTRLVPDRFQTALEIWEEHLDRCRAFDTIDEHLHDLAGRLRKVADEVTG